MRRGAGGFVVGVLALTAVVVLFGADGAFADQTITSSGPLTSIQITSDLNCAVNANGDSSGEWFGNTACGTFVAVNGTLYGPADIPAGEGLDTTTPHVAWTPVSQSAVTGSGTIADPFTVTTVVTGGTNVQVTQVDSYVVGQESYRTDDTVKNTSGSAETLKLYIGGDCFQADSDVGFGRVDTVSAGPAPTCVGEDANGNPSTRIEQLTPLTAGDFYVEDFFNTMWTDIGTQNNLPNTCQCSTSIDNSIAINWSFSLAAGASATFSHLSTFSNGGTVPVIAGKTADASSATPGARDGYTVTFQNPNTSAIVLSSVTDTLPDGFGYVAGSTTGGITGDPTVTGSQLQWNGSFSVAAGGTLTFHFNVTVAATPGTYTNSVTAGSTTDAVAGATAVAPITVTSTGMTTTTVGTTTTTLGTTTTTTGVPVVTSPALPLDALPIAATMVGATGLVVWLRRRRWVRSQP
ncbi:MAG TPA: hypothetical protein VHT30_03260 [Acidimicrobiales bacterium]|jgi:hypothetical protein|nr:hypothetical protein [Acidimicrobiales bacterium]